MSRKKLLRFVQQVLINLTISKLHGCIFLKCVLGLKKNVRKVQDGHLIGAFF